jgi:ABC-type lipoprotein export system ATPase subunit
LLARGEGFRPEALSGGQRQRLALARVFASDSPCLLLDEPTTGLAAGDRERILGDLLAWRKERPGTGAVLVSHEPFLGEFCGATLRLDAAGRGAARAAGGPPAGKPA